MGSCRPRGLLLLPWEAGREEAPGPEPRSGCCPSLPQALGSPGLAGPSQAVSVLGWLEEPRGHRASAPGSAESEVTGGTPVLCK